MSFLDGGKAEPEWEDWMDNPVSRATGIQCFGWILIVALSTVVLTMALALLRFWALSPSP